MSLLELLIRDRELGHSWSFISNMRRIKREHAQELLNKVRPDLVKSLPTKGKYRAHYAGKH